MTDLTPRTPYRPLTWIDPVLDLQDLLADYPDPVYIVGGAVRDALLSRPIKDIDLATPGDAIAVARKIANSLPNGSLFIMDAERGVARAIIETMYGVLNVDVAAFRGDGILADLTDRDFTINAMMVDLNSDLTQIIDPLNGERDVADKLIRQCRPGAITADPIRAMRAVRQSTQLGYRIEPVTLKAVRDGTTHLDGVSAERVRDELFKVLQLKRPTAALRVMYVIGLLDAALPISSVADQATVAHLFLTMDKLTEILAGLVPGETDNIASNFGVGLALVQLNRIRPQLANALKQTWATHRVHRTLLMLTTLVQPFSPDDDGIGAVAERLRLSNDEKKRLMTSVGNRVGVLEMPGTDALALHRFWYEVGGAGVDICLLTLADYLAANNLRLNQSAWLPVVERVQTTLEAYYLHHDTIVIPPPVITGDDLIAQLGIKPGPLIGNLLAAIREAQVTGQVTSAEDAVNFARAALGDDPRGGIRR
jgi:tRNA nucleotidyltransferase/poly(A) polymerase